MYMTINQRNCLVYLSCTTADKDSQHPSDGNVIYYGGMPGDRQACWEVITPACLAAALQCGSTFIPHVYYVIYVSTIIQDR